MAHASEIPRRNVTKTIAALLLYGAAAGVAGITRNLEINFSEQSPEFIKYLLRLKHYKKSFLNPPHKNLIGTAVNIPFAAYSNDPTIAIRVEKQMRLLNSHVARVYIPNEFEKPTGNYDLSYISQLNNFIEQVSRYSNRRIGFDVVLDDSYNLLYSELPAVYGSKRLDHHALNYSIDPEKIQKYQQDFFTTETRSNEFIRREKTILSALYPVKDKLRAIEIINEPDIHFAHDFKVTALSDWYSRTVPPVREMYPDLPIISGVKNPYLIDSARLREVGLDHNSAHPYGKDTFEQASVSQYIQEMTWNSDLTPLLVLETGVAGKVGIVDLPDQLHDSQMAESFADMITSNSFINDDLEEITLPVATYAPWQQDVGPMSRDWFQYDPYKYHLMRETMQIAADILSFN